MHYFVDVNEMNYEISRLDPSLSPVNIEVGTSILYVEEGTEAVSCTVL